MDMTSLENVVADTYYKTTPYKLIRLEKFPFFMDYLFKEDDLILHLYLLVDVNRLHDQIYVRWLKDQEVKPWPKNTPDMLKTEIIDHFGGSSLLSEDRISTDWIPEFYSYHTVVKRIASGIKPTELSIKSLFEKIAKKLLE
jgi:hypothetical protein